MFCENCGTQNVDRAPVCLRCGQPLMQPTVAPRRKKKRSREPGLGALITVGIFMLLSAILLILTFL